MSAMVVFGGQVTGGGKSGRKLAGGHGHGSLGMAEATILGPTGFRSVCMQPAASLLASPRPPVALLSRGRRRSAPLRKRRNQTPYICRRPTSGLYYGFIGGAWSGMTVHFLLFSSSFFHFFVCRTVP